MGRKTDRETKPDPDEEGKFVLIDGLRFEKTPHGLIYCPEYQDDHRKHHCPDCMTCAWCSDPRCALCKNEGNDIKGPKKLPIIR